ncbi:hypothetical protein ACFFGR_01955 [Arthrobacter liuii]|uniref:PknH-like extracellular domain-containing protein n=1 Tax=Arthrobacter liuii TaxID=1476996 RepID=A0ABQ2AY42_9MICC|nr:hypothetical protein [Arthrobacter liuii]GGI01897.1 hypothetical protein GCM10007170_42390 [Arthrobacter liuii]
MPSQPFTDAELAAIINGVAQVRNLPFPAAQDSTRLRSGAAAGSLPAAGMETTPGECLAFVPRDPFTRWADKDINFAEGAMPSAGGQSGPTSTIMVALRSADKDAIAKADFNYTDNLVSRCGQFDLAYTESGRTSTYAVQLLAAPPVGEKQHAFMQVTKPKGPGDFGSVGLRVLSGTLSITLSLAVANLNSESDAKPALEAMAALAKELLGQALKGTPSVAAPSPNSLTPDQMVALFKGVTGPNGEPVSLPQATVLGASPGFTPGASSPPPDSPCTISDQSYSAALVGSVSGQGQIQGANKMDYTDFTVINMPSTMAQPYPFDSRVEHLRGCTSIQESMFGSGGRTWSPASPLNVAVAADSSYALAYQLSDGTGEWHVRMGARRGTLSIEAGSRTASQSATQAKADALAAFFGTVFSRAGK